MGGKFVSQSGTMRRKRPSGAISETGLTSKLTGAPQRREL